MKFLSTKAQTPQQLKQTFICAAAFFSLLLALFAGAGTYLFTKSAAINEAEHDALVFSQAFLEDEGRVLLYLLSHASDRLPAKTSLPKPAVKIKQAAKYYTIQAGSYSRKEGAFRVLHLLTEKLAGKDRQFLRVEKISDLHAVRVGKFSNKTDASILQQEVSRIAGAAIIIEAKIDPERIELVADGTRPPAPEVEETDLTSPMQGTFNPGLDLFRDFDLRMRNQLNSLEIAAIEIFSTEAEILYSTDFAKIGSKLSDHNLLQAALQGLPRSQSAKLTGLADPAGVQHPDLEVVATYLPLRDKDQSIIGAFKISQDLSRTQRNRLSLALKASFLTALILAAVFILLFQLPARFAIAYDHLQDELVKRSSFDNLTGLLNRSFLYRRMEEEFSRIKTKNRDQEHVQSIGCLMVDIDYFKSFNDRYGHELGDAIIRMVAKRIELSLRDYDLAGRYGGEEFVVILPNSTFEDARIVAERIWSSIRTAPFVQNGEQYKLSVSIGLATLTGKDKKIDDVINKADLLLRKAKESGRDQICWHDSPANSKHNQPE